MRRTVRHDCPRTCLHPATVAALPSTPEVLFHWSPTANRPRILRLGLTPGRLSVDRQWRPPHVCFSHDPETAWRLSGRNHPHIDEWDLWMVFAATLEGYEAILDTYVGSGRHYVKEVRVYHRVYKRNVLYVASRTSPRASTQTR